MFYCNLQKKTNSLLSTLLQESYYQKKKKSTINLSAFEPNNTILIKLY